MPFVYILRCADSSLYVGETNGLDTRLLKHNDGSACRYTALRRPVTLVYAETHKIRDAARDRERQLKRWTRAKKEALIANDPGLLKRLTDHKGMSLRLLKFSGGSVDDYAICRSS